MLREIFRSLFRKGSFTQDVAIVGSGKIIVAVIGFIFIPILSRIYDPEAYGLFSLYNASVTILIIFFQGSYPESLVIIKEEKTFYNILTLSFLLSILGGLITFLILYIFFEPINELSSSIIPESFLFFIPFGIIINGMVIMLSQLNIRRKSFRLSATLEAGGNLVIRLVNLIYGLITKGEMIGLIIGNQAGISAATYINFTKNYKKELSGLKNSVSPQILLESAKVFINYPKYILPSKLLATLNGQLPVYLIGGAFGKSALGSFSMSSTLLNIPIQIVANSISAIFLKNASNLYHYHREGLSPFILKLVDRLFLAGVIPFSFLTVFGEDLIQIFLGSEWQEAGLYSSLLSPYFYIYLIFTPIYSLLQLLKKENILFRFTITRLIINTSVLIYAIWQDNIIMAITLFSFSNLIISILQGRSIFRLIDLKFNLFIVKVLVSFLFVSFIFWIIKLWIL